MTRIDRCAFMVIFPALLFTGWLRGSDEKKAEPVTVKTVKAIQLAMTKKQPPGLTITVIGEVPSGGFSDVKLTPYTYVKQPDDGIQDFTLTAIPPDGPAIQALQDVKATYVYDVQPDWLKGVRIHGAEGVEKLLK